MNRARAIDDLTWLKHLMTGQVLEEFRFEGHRAVAVRIPDTDRTATGQFHLRLFFFPPDSTRPTLSVNLESSILGEYLLTVRSAAGAYQNLGTASEHLSWPEFRERALAAARAGLPPGPGPVDQEREIGHPPGDERRPDRRTRVGPRPPSRHRPRQ